MSGYCFEQTVIILNPRQTSKEYPKILLIEEDFMMDTNFRIHENVRKSQTLSCDDGDTDQSVHA